MTRVAALLLAPQPELKRVLCKKAGKSTSGVLVITVLTSPYPTERLPRPTRAVTAGTLPVRERLRTPSTECSDESSLRCACQVAVRLWSAAWHFQAHEPCCDRACPPLVRKPGVSSVDQGRGFHAAALCA